MNETAWEQIFEKYNILEEVNGNDIFIITADQIKEFREPRLMTKFDHSSNLPTIFAENNLSILPITRGSYLIGCFETFHDFKFLSVISDKNPAVVVKNKHTFLVYAEKK